MPYNIEGNLLEVKLALESQTKYKYQGHLLVNLDKVIEETAAAGNLQNYKRDGRITDNHYKNFVDTMKYIKAPGDSSTDLALDIVWSKLEVEFTGSIGAHLTKIYSLIRCLFKYEVLQFSWDDVRIVLRDWYRYIYSLVDIELEIAEEESMLFSENEWAWVLDENVVKIVEDLGQDVSADAHRKSLAKAHANAMAARCALRGVKSTVDDMRTIDFGLNPQV